MAVDPNKPRRVLVVHGVQTGRDRDQNQHRTVRDLIRGRLGNQPLRFDTRMYRYENVNDAAQRTFKRLVGLIAGAPVASAVAQQALDLVGDVVIALDDGSTAAEIRRGLRERILEIHDAGNPCYLLAHSLGSIYAFDVVNELIADGRWFDRGSRRTWPVQALTTIGSPIGLGMFRVPRRRKVRGLGAGDKWFRWVNLWDRTDPVVSGRIFGRRLNGYEIAERYRTDAPGQGWVIRDVAVDTGKVWLMAHVAYWDNPTVGDTLFNMITN